MCLPATPQPPHRNHGRLEMQQLQSGSCVLYQSMINAPAVATVNSSCIGCASSRCCGPLGLLALAAAAFLLGTSSESQAKPNLLQAAAKTSPLPQPLMQTPGHWLMMVDGICEPPDLPKQSATTALNSLMVPKFELSLDRLPSQRQSSNLDEIRPGPCHDISHASLAGGSLGQRAYSAYDTQTATIRYSQTCRAQGRFQYHGYLKLFTWRELKATHTHIKGMATKVSLCCKARGLSSLQCQPCQQ